MNKKKKVLINILIVLIGLFVLCINKESIFDLLNKLSISFRRTIIDEQRYLLLLNGLYATLIISFTSVIIGSSLSVLVCLGRLCNIKLIKVLSKAYISILQGTPITVLLLIFYYVLFARVNISPMFVAIIVFSIYLSAYVAEIYRGAYESINHNQKLSAYSLGFTKFQTLIYILIPQMLTSAIPAYKNEIVAVIKLTSIVGFISVMDLTRASELIRNRTYEAFFPLIFAAAVYYLICLIVSKLLDLLYKKINKKEVQ